MPFALIVGLDPRLLVDPTLPVNASRVRENMDAAITELEQAGIQAELFLLEGATAEVIPKLRTALVERTPDAVMIGAGVRLEPELSWLLEMLVNAIIEHAPGVKLCFNEDPESMARAVRRVLSV